jgi:4-hydroxy-3-methylbut-2-en-1-yl diphosphate reductase
VVVIGGAHSNNTQELVKTCSQHCGRVHHVQSSNDLCEDWFDGAQTVGITAGTSTPDASIRELERWLEQLAARSNHDQAAFVAVELHHKQAA